MKENLANSVERVVIVGGGTAGWLTAAVLAKQLGCSENGAVSVTLVESPDVPILGVGEGTWPNLRGTLQRIGVDEGVFMRECDATFKQGAKFVNWSDDPNVVGNHSYYHPLNSVSHSAYGFNLAPYWLLDDSKSKKSYDLAVSAQGRICDLGLAPKKITTPGYQALQEYSYHLNANKFSIFLQEHCVSKLGVVHIKANVTDINLDDEGYIVNVSSDLASSAIISGDLFIDCTGSKALLIEKALGIGWKSISDVILNDTALAMQVPYAEADTPIATHTISTAHEAGWTWDIGLKDRRGVGYVYSSKHSSDERAEEVLRKYVGPIGDSIAVRKIPLNHGYREKFWHKNCVAIGMSAGFVEPLEASAIYLADAASNMIADQFPQSRDEMKHVESKFNSSFRMRMDRSIDFIKLHYCISKRRDTQYWIDNCDPKTVPDTLAARLAHWKIHPPSKFDFDYSFEPFILDSYLYVLYGMGFETNIARGEAFYRDGKLASQMFDNVDRITDTLVSELPQQRDLIEKVYKYGFSSV